MRIRVIQTPTQHSIDGIRLDGFLLGLQYEVGSLLAAVMLAEGWAEPVTSDEPALLFRLRDFSPQGSDNPPNLIREIVPPYADIPAALAADRRRKPRTPKKIC